MDSFEWNKYADLFTKEAAWSWSPGDKFQFVRLAWL